jgi:microcystin-dependent protein
VTTNQIGFPNIVQPVVGVGGRITQSWLNLFQTLWNRTGAVQGGNVVSTGMGMDFYGPASAIPSGYLLMDGSAVSRTVYAALFSVIGVTWGAGDGSTTFNLPNAQNAFSMGSGVYQVGTTGGTSSITLSVANLPEHNHPIIDPGHYHTALVSSSTNTAGSGAGTAIAGNTGTATTGITTDFVGTGTPFSNLPPFVTCLKLIKT